MPKSHIPQQIPPLPAGIYDVTIIGAKQSVSSTGKPMFVLRVEVEPSGKRVIDYISLTDRALWKAARLFTSVGEKLEVNRDLSIEELIGRRGRARIVIDEYQYQELNKIADWLPPKHCSAPETETDSDEVL